MMSISSKITGYGHCVPSKSLTNDDLSKIVDTNDEWISTRTGIRSRYIAENETTSDLAAKAAQMALKNANISAQDIDLLVLGTITPDYTTPSVALVTAKKIGIKEGVPAFDISAACSGFVYSLTMADNMIRLGQAKNALVIGAETLSKITDWSDRGTCVLFGDGAGAVVLQATENEDETGVLSTKIFAACDYVDHLRTNGGVSTTKQAGYITMDGKEVFKYAVNALAAGADAALSIAKLSADDVDWLLPHQANIRIIDGTAQKMGFDKSKVLTNIANHGNTSAASIPLALSQKVNDGTVKKGDIVLLTSMGAGFTWGGAVIKI